MNIDEAKNYIFGLARKNQVGNIPINQLNVMFQRAQLEIVEELRKAYEITSVISDNLSTLVSTVEVYNSADVFTKPQDFFHWVDIYAYAFTNGSKCGDAPIKEWVPVELIPHNKLAYRMSSTIVRAETLNPVAINYGNYYSVFPIPSKISLTYIRIPKKPVWGYVDGPVPVYDPTKSQDFELPEPMHNMICFKVLSYIGISTRDADLYQTTNGAS